MLCETNRIVIQPRVLSILLICTGMLNYAATSTLTQLNPGNTSTSTETSTLNLLNIVKNLLDNIESAEEWNEHISAALVFAEFLIKQKIDMHRELTTVNSNGKNSYFEILDKIDLIRGKIMKSFDVHNLEALLQENVLYADTIIRENQIDKRLEYTSLVQDYASMEGTGFPSYTLANLCVLHIHGLEHCHHIRQQCIASLKPSAPNFGYQRMHQVLQIFMLMHHICARLIGSQLYFEILATEHCSQVYREHRVIRVLNTQDWQDLYVEQSAICGLFGFNEFLNIPELLYIISWESDTACNCIRPANMLNTFRGLCSCADHKHSVALINVGDVGKLVSSQENDHDHDRTKGNCKKSIYTAHG